MLIRTFVLRVTNNEKKVLTDHEINDRIAEQIELVITEICKESKFWIYPNLRQPSFSFTYSFKLTYFCIVYIYTLKKKFC